MASAKANPVPLIIFIVLFVFATTGLVLATMEMTKLRQQADEGFRPNSPGAATYDQMRGLKRAVQERDQKLTELNLELDKFKEVVGTMTADELKEELRKRIELIKQGGGERGPADSTHLIGFISVLEKEKNLLNERLAEQQKVNDAQRRQFDGQLREEENKVREKQTLADNLNAEIEKLKTNLAREKDSGQQEAKTLRSALDRTRLDMRNIEGTKNEEIKRLEKYALDLERQLAALRGEKSIEGKGSTFEAELEPADAKVIYVDSKAGIVLDIGQQKGIKRGLKFQSYSLKADGSRVSLGEIEVKTVFPEISRAIFSNGGDPVDKINIGDIVVNPAFDPNKAKVFVADTTFDAAKKQAFREALAEYGSVLEDDVSLRTDYLVVGSQNGRLVEKAEKLGVTMINEEVLNRFLGR